jgi:hypothetical protein
MPNSPNTHWTTDEHLLAQYVLGRLNAPQAASLEKHLRDCPQCRDAVAAEQQLTAGVRRAGRDALKHRLAQRLEQKRSGTNWYRVAGIAAAFVVLLTVGIYNKWFFSGETRLADSGLKSDSITQKTEPTPHQPAPGQQSAEKMQLADVSKPSATDRDRAESKGAGARNAELDKKKGEVEGVPGKSDNIPFKRDQMIVAAEAEGIWVEGTVVSEEANVRAAAKAMDKISEDSRENAPKGKKEPAALMSRAARSRSLPTEGPAVLVSQRSVSDLPRNQMRGKQNLSQVQTLIRSDASGLSMVLYLDSLLNRTDLRQARLQTIREDSMILQIGSQRIGYRLPPDLTGQLAKQLKKAP